MRMVITLDFHDYEPTEDQLDAELDRVRAMIADDYTSGEITIHDDDETHRGWWTLAEVMASAPVSGSSGR